MSIVSLDDILIFMGIDDQYFSVNASNDVLKLKYDSGSVTDVDIPDGTYNGTTLATAMQTIINSTLTCSSTVAWNTTTRKFTITIGAGHTLAYTHAGSDGGILVGLNQDHSAALSITSDIAIGDPTAIVAIAHNAAEKEIQNYCRRNFESTSYKERYNGNGTNHLLLNQYPIISISRLSLWSIDVIRILNTNKATTATVSVTSTGIVLTKDGVDTTLLFATYTTMTLIMNAINALSANGWSASLNSSDYGDYLSTELIPKFGQSCIRSNSIYLQIPYDAEGSFDVDAEGGIITLEKIIDNAPPFVFPRGTKNIFVDYTAGYSSSDMPNDLALAVKIYTKFLWQKTSEESFGVKSQSSGGVSVTYEGEIPVEAKRILDNRYRRMVV